MPLQQVLDHQLSRLATWWMLFKLAVKEGPLSRVEIIKIRSGDHGFDVFIWHAEKAEHPYLFTVTDFFGDFPRNMEPPKSSKTFTPGNYLDVMQQYLNIHSYVDRLNTGELQPKQYNNLLLMLAGVPIDAAELNGSDKRSPFDDTENHPASNGP